MKLKRYIFLSQLKAEALGGFPDALREGAGSLLGLLEAERTFSFSLFRHAGLLCVYMETLSEDVRFAWPEPVRKLLLAWPGEAEPRYVVEMADIFHDGVPVDPASWREGRTIDEAVGSLAVIKPDMLASYTYYHFQKQEEDASSFNKTYIIGEYGGLLFSYQELPAELSVGKPGKPGYRIDVDWQELMEPHFRPWEDTGPDERLWRKMERAADLTSLSRMAKE